MNIYPVNSNDNISMYGKGINKDPRWVKRVKQKILDMLPSATSKESKKSVKNWDKISHWVGDPMWNRGIMGATALLTQPAIDYYNHRVDDETRTVSRNRTIAKILAGTVVGMFFVRGPVYKMVEKMTNTISNKKWEKSLLPKKYIKKLAENPNELRNYRSAIAMVIALGVMCFTNFLLDAPLTIFLTNYFNKKSGIEADKKKNSYSEPETKIEKKEGKNV